MIKFQVFLEECPTESFMDVSADKCWGMVLRRLNQEIVKLENSALKPLDSVNGLEMFGLSSPPIIQVYLYLLDNFILKLLNTFINYNDNLSGD